MHGSKEAALNYLTNEALKIEDGPLKVVCLRMLDDPRFEVGFGSSGHHHAYEGGLVVHTAEVLRNALHIARHAEVNLDVLRAAAILHDYHKIHEYEWGENEKGERVIVKTWYRQHISHVHGSFGWFMAEAEKMGVKRHLIEQIGHAILAHHGRPEWGSNIEPATREAFLLHTADMMSARFGITGL